MTAMIELSPSAALRAAGDRIANIPESGPSEVVTADDEVVDVVSISLADYDTLRRAAGAALVASTTLAGLAAYQPTEDGQVMLAISPDLASALDRADAIIGPMMDLPSDDPVEPPSAAA